MALSTNTSDPARTVLGLELGENTHVHTHPKTFTGRLVRKSEHSGRSQMSIGQMDQDQLQCCHKGRRYSEQKKVWTAYDNVRTKTISGQKKSN